MNRRTFLIAALGPALAGRHGKVFVLLKDSDHRKPITGATIEIVPTSFTGKGYILETDRSGTASHVALPEGTYQVIAYGAGYAPIEVQDVLIEADRTVTLALEAVTAELAPYKKKTLRYKRPTVDLDSTGVRYVFRG